MVLQSSEEKNYFVTLLNNSALPDLEFPPLYSPSLHTSETVSKDRCLVSLVVPRQSSVPLLMDTWCFFSAEAKPSTAQVRGTSLARAQDSHRRLRVTWRSPCGCVVSVIAQLAPRISAQLADQQEPLVQLGAQTLPRWSF